MDCKTCRTTTDDLMLIRAGAITAWMCLPCCIDMHAEAWSA